MTRFRTFFALAATLVLATALAGPTVAAGRPFTTELLGTNEPSGGDLDGVGSAHITINAGTGEVCWWLQAENIVLPALASHIHIAPAGINGPIVIPLSPPGADGTSSGCATADRSLLRSILVSPASYYVNVHTSTNPGGAVRGQLSH